MNRPNPLAAYAPHPRTRRPRRQQRVVLAVCCWAYLVVVLGVWYMLGSADHWWPATVLMFAPLAVLAVPLVVLVPWAWWERRRYLVLLALTGLLIAGPVMDFCIPWNRFFSGQSTGTRFRVLTCNMHSSRADPELLATLVADTLPDIVALQEWPGEELPQVRTDTGWHIHRTPSLYLASRYPIKKVTILGTNSYSPEANAGHFELDTPVGVVHLFSLHFASPRKAINEARQEDEEAVPDIEANSELRWEQTDSVALAAAAVKGPLLLVGDFNTPYQSVMFDRVWSRYTDVFRAAGWGWGYTFYGSWTMVRIDHILAGPGWVSELCWVGPDVGSLHRPVLAHLSWTGKKE